MVNGEGAITTGAGVGAGVGTRVASSHLQAAPQAELHLLESQPSIQPEAQPPVARQSSQPEPQPRESKHSDSRPIDQPGAQPPVAKQSNQPEPQPQKSSHSESEPNAQPEAQHTEAKQSNQHEPQQPVPQQLTEPGPQQQSEPQAHDVQPAGPRVTHQHYRQHCRICTSCFSCTGFGNKCILVTEKDRQEDSGKSCGCGLGDFGCALCGQCTRCASMPDTPGICSGPTVVGSPSQILKKANHENSAGPSEQTPEAPMRILEDSGEIGVISTGCLAVTAGCQGAIGVGDQLECSSEVGTVIERQDGGRRGVATSRSLSGGEEKGEGKGKLGVTPLRPKPHCHTCRICPRCFGCTGWGHTCVRTGAGDKSTKAGQASGCGMGESGCSACGLCLECCGSSSPSCEGFCWITGYGDEPDPLAALPSAFQLRPCPPWTLLEFKIIGLRGLDVIACGVLCISKEKVSRVALSFRAAVEAPMHVENGTESRDLYGLEYGSGLNQDLGGVVLRAGRCVSFPNVYQHKIEPFQLIEGQPAGHVHLLSLSLVHPNHKLVSTSEVPPQQLEWLKEAIFADPDSRLSKLPSGLAELIGRTLDEISEFPISAGTEMRNSIDMNEERIYKGVNLNTTHDEKRLHGN
eukprot:gene4943-34714_t